MAHFYDQFDILTNNGAVLDQDLSTLETLPPNDLLPVERAARTNWINIRSNQLTNHYRVLEGTPVTSQEILLQQRIVPPMLVVGRASPRGPCARRGRQYPRRLYVWEDFRLQVEAFVPPAGAEPLVPADFQVFARSLQERHQKVDEKSEELFHQIYVLEPLREANLLKFRSDQRSGQIGLPDFVLGDSIVEAVVEYKSTRNLPVPMNAANVVNQYNNGCRNNPNDSSIRRDRERVGQPFGQLFGYMSLNQCRYGALTSGTRTYFCYVDHNNNVRVSEAWFIGQENYLRAWAYFYAQTSEEGDRLPGEMNWDASGDEDYMPEDEGDGHGSDDAGKAPGKSDSDDAGTDLGQIGQRGGCKRKEEQSGGSRKRSGGEHAFSSLPTIPVESIKILGPLGYGRNGCVFHVRWNGIDAAMKQFDVGQPFGLQCFEKEVEAYELLKEAQGVLVPKALFLSEATTGGVKYLGLQLGRDPKEGDDTSGFRGVLDALESEFGFRHKDADRRNGLFIKDAGGTERLVAIDLEDFRRKRKKT